MEAATWVALVLGLGSLCLTVILDGRNRDERLSLDRAERSERLAREQRESDERDRTRWLEDRKATYLAYLDAVDARYSRLHALWRGISYGYDAKDESGEATDSSSRARQLALLAPTPIASSVQRVETLLRSAEWAAQLHSVSVTQNQADTADPGRHPAAALRDELDGITAEVDALREAMRVDLGVT